jgi:lipoprotein-anchoring transpeptidase ErfK/SrfK
MGARGKHAARVRRRLAALLATAAASTGVVIAAAVASHGSAGVRATVLSWSRTSATLGRFSSTSALVAAGNAGRRLGLPAMAAGSLPPLAGQPPSRPLVLTARDIRMCPPPATACVDLTRHLTWLQSGGRVTFGPVRMEPGPPGTVHATPRGTFQVSWKAGPYYISTTYGDPMPWAVFFAPGGIAFHGGSLTKPSHGCVHLTVANARYYNEHLPIGAEVVVF